MTVSESSKQQNVQVTYLDDEIDLRQYIVVLLNWWREIFLIAFGLAMLAGLAVLSLRLLPAKYEATASVAVVRVQSDVTFDEKFTTRADDQTTNSSANARRSALINLVQSDAIAQKVINRLGDKLTAEEQDTNTLTENITVDATGTSAGKTSDSDLIQIAVVADSSEKAAEIATIWAEIFVKEANATFGQTEDNLIASVVAMQADAKSDYETKQAAVVKFLTESRVDELSRQITRKEQVIKELQNGEQNALHSLLAQVNAARGTVSQSYLNAQAESEIAKFEAQKQGQQELLRAYIGAQYQSQIDVFQQQYQRNLQLLTTYNNATVRLQKTLGSAQVLKTQIEGDEGEVDGGTVANLQLLKLQTFTDLLERSTPPVNPAQPAPITQGEALAQMEGSSSPSVSTTIAQPIQVDMQMLETPLQLQVSTSDTMSKTAALIEIDSLIAIVQTRLEQLSTQIDQVGQAMLDGDSYDHLTPSLVSENELQQAIDVQDSLLRAMISAQPTNTVQSDVVITTGISVPFLNFAELQQIADQYGNNDNLLPAAIATLESEIRSLRSELEAAQATQRELAQQRDLAWSTFTTVNNKVAELTVAKAAASSEVRFAAEAIPPSEPIKGPSTLLAVVVGGMAGAMLAILYALIASSMGQIPFLKGSAA